MDGYWILLGMMGAGKTTIGRNLSDRLDIPFVDVDRLLEHRLGRPIHQLFTLYGEDAFRGHETSVLRSLDREPGVLSTGGGAVVRPENWQEFARLGRTIFLDVPPAKLKQRLVTSKRRRPLLEVENWEDQFDALYEKRIALYRKADLVMTIEEKEVEPIAERLAEVLLSWN